MFCLYYFSVKCIIKENIISLYSPLKMPILLNIFLRTLGFTLKKCCYSNIILPCGHSRQPLVTRKRLPSLSLSTQKRMRESCQRLRKLLEATAGCHKCPQYDGKCSFYFNCYLSTQLQQTETSDRQLSIFRSGI